MEKVNWTQLQGNKYLQSLHPAMLTDQGYTIEKFDRIIGMSKYADKIPLSITYDRSYVIAYLEKAVFQKLNFQEWNQVPPIMSEAWKKHRTNTK